MAFRIFLSLVLTCGILVCQARHIHPGNDGGNLYRIETVNDEPINILQTLKPTRFVPLNSPQFFKISEPCKDGYKRDAMGICRE
ncbi:hypothetical protein KGM_212125A, partial [Danaus plexippus plexippus]